MATSLRGPMAQGSRESRAIEARFSIQTMKFLVGTKQYMTTVFAEDGRAHAVTVVKAEPALVSQIKTKEKDGYAAVQLAFGKTKEARINKPQIGHVKGAGAYAHFKEYQPETIDKNVGDTVDVSIFAAGDNVAVSAISKGKGFQGVVKRHGFGGGRRSHGQKHSEREPGSIGGGGRAGGRVIKGMRMAGRMGSDRITVKNLTVIQVNPETHEIAIKGAIPGRRGTLVEILG
jgi:large subunit ribosomal protein L3